mmetsp:Transcript_3054/g.6788  ORF Transcript_3054/g.6788 Transcript_3054/m.6788 type:complete len:213 (-) Transcript_3054:5308-5946(-)
MNGPFTLRSKKAQRKMPNIVLLGPPGAGKGTQSKKLISKYQLVPIAPGDLLREQIHKKTTLGHQVAAYINAGKLAPDAFVIDIVEKELEANKHGHGLLFDGFPRTIMQAKALDTKLANYKMRIHIVIFLEVPEKELVHRINARAQLVGRVDDQDQAKIVTRMRIYHNETLPVATYYTQQGKLFRVSGTGTVDATFDHILDTLERLTVGFPPK